MNNSERLKIAASLREVAATLMALGTGSVRPDVGFSWESPDGK